MNRISELLLPGAESVSRVLSRWHRLSLLFVVALLAGRLAAGSATDLRETVMNIGLSPASFSNVNQNDAVVAWNVALERLGKQKGYKLRSITAIFEHAAEFEAALVSGKLNMAIIDTWQFLELEHHTALQPIFVPIINNEVGRRFVVVVRRGSGIRTLSELRGKSVAWLQSSKTNACLRWIESLLPADSNLPMHPTPGDWEVVVKPTGAILSVFFGQKTACVVDENSFALMRELNPQVDQQLEVLATSERFVDVIICLTTTAWEVEAARIDVISSLSELGTDAAGRQILALFKISGVATFQPHHLETIRILRQAQVISPAKQPNKELHP